MRIATVLSVLFCLLCAQFALAQNLSVSYLEGEVTIRGSTAWTELAIGDVVPLDSLVRLSESCFVQIKGDGLELTLSRPGTYVVREIVRARRTVSSPGVGAALTASLRHLAFGPTEQQSMAMGARGANQSNSEDGGWVESNAEVFLLAASEYIKAGRYDGAIDQIRQALQVATEQETPEIHYYLAYACSLKGDEREAWKQIADLQPSDGDAWAGDLILLKAKLLEDTSAYEEAVTWLTQERNDLSQDAQRAPLYYFLLGLGCRGSGEGENARQAFSRVVAISGESDLGKAASKLLQLP